MELYWTSKAQTDLINIANYIRKDNSKAALLFISNIRKRTIILKSNASLGRIVPELSDKHIRELIYKNYRVVYRIKDNSIIEILTVFEGHMQLHI